jgi:hypothetical protein
MTPRLELPLAMAAALSMLGSASAHGQQKPTLTDLLNQLRGTTVFWRQFEVPKQIATMGDARALVELEPWLHRSDRLSGQGIPRRAIRLRQGGGSKVRFERIGTTRVHLFGELKDRRAEDVLLLPKPQRQPSRSTGGTLLHAPDQGDVTVGAESGDCRAGLRTET